MTAALTLRRYKRMLISRDVLAGWIKGFGSPISRTNVPQDIRVIAIRDAVESDGEIEILLESEHFDEVDVGDVTPRFEPCYSTKPFWDPECGKEPE